MGVHTETAETPSEVLSGRDCIRRNSVWENASLDPYIAPIVLYKCINLFLTLVTLFLCVT